MLDFIGSEIWVKGKGDDNNDNGLKPESIPGYQISN